MHNPMKSLIPAASRALLSVAAVAVLWPAHARAGDFFRDDATRRWTATSGSGDSSWLEHTPSANEGIYGIGVAETGDKPQEINFLNNILSSGAGKTMGGEFLRLFNGATGMKYATLPTDYYITAVQACVNNNRIKGLRVWGTKLDANGLPTGALVSAEFQRTNCGANDWAEKVSCGAEKVAVGARANYYGNFTGSKTTFSGITLHCGKTK
jgi:hypothetical protein